VRSKADSEASLVYRTQFCCTWYLHECYNKVLVVKMIFMLYIKAYTHVIPFLAVSELACESMISMTIS